MASPGSPDPDPRTAVRTLLQGTLEDVKNLTLVGAQWQLLADRERCAETGVGAEHYRLKTLTVAEARKLADAGGVIELRDPILHTSIDLDVSELRDLSDDRQIVISFRYR